MDFEMIAKIQEAARHARTGDEVSFCGMRNVPYEVLVRSLRLYRRFHRNPYGYLQQWCEFQNSKGA